MGYVYVAGNSVLGFYKIGSTGNLIERLKKIKTFSPYAVDLVLYFTTHTFKKVENTILEHFIKSRLDGEVYRFNLDELKQCAELGFTLMRPKNPADMWKNTWSEADYIRYVVDLFLDIVPESEIRVPGIEWGKDLFEGLEEYKANCFNSLLDAERAAHGELIHRICGRCENPLQAHDEYCPVCH